MWKIENKLTLLIPPLPHGDDIQVKRGRDTLTVKSNKDKYQSIILLPGDVLTVTRQGQEKFDYSSIATSLHSQQSTTVKEKGEN